MTASESDGRLPTARDYLQGPDLSLVCENYLHQSFADMAAPVAAERGDVPLIQLRFRCRKCGSSRIDARVTGAGPSAASRSRSSLDTDDRIGRKRTRWCMDRQAD